MIEDTIRKIEAQLQSSEAIKPERRAELIELIRHLRNEVAQLHQSEANNIAELTQTCAEEAIKEERDAEQLDLSVKSLNASVQGFEDSHPRLVQVVNSISQTLANIGI